jgi:hypothetical protein
MRRACPRTLLAALALGTLALAGCGSGGSTSTTTSRGHAAPTAAAKAARAAEKQAAASTRAAEAAAPKGASPTLRAIYRSFPAPVVGQHEGAGAAAAIAAGERACRGKTPLQVKEEFYGEAKEHLEAEQTAMIARIAAYEAHDATDPGFVAGQLAADVYAATLEEEEAQAGYRGCVHALAQGLEHRLAPQKKR